MTNHLINRWIATDLEAKIEILKTKRNSPDINESYDDVQTMVKQELSNKSIKFKEKDDSSGTRNLLRLHRALEFIIMFMESIGKLSGPEKCVAVAQVIHAFFYHHSQLKTMQVT